MTKSRNPETDHGIQGEITVALYDQMQRTLRDRGWIETQALLDSGISQGNALEIGHGPGYLGLEWLRRTQDTTLTGLDISPEMRTLAMKHAESYRLATRASYHLGSCDHLPFDDGRFDAVFTTGSVHEWSNPGGAFEEIWRVLKPGGRYFIEDLRRDMNPLVYAFLWLGTKPAAMRPGLRSSIAAAYTPREFRNLAAGTRLQGGKCSGNMLGVLLSGKK
jgi:ubiquinone/menaquinone biosynthesis C-methylase UbiE